MSLEKNEELRTINNNKKPNKGPYLLGEALGEGAFAKVRLATQIHIKEKCAIKIVDKRLIEGTKDIQRLKKEIKILKSIRHKNIIQLFDIMESKTNLYFVLEYCKGGELFDYIVKNKRLKEGEACIFFQQIINGVEYLHNQGIIHRDLKPENLLLDYKNNIKISDFGLSTFFSKNNFLQTACGTPFYAPPEMLEGLQYNGESSDIWSCGIILYAMLCGTLPFSESKEEIIVKKIKAHDYIIPNYLSKEAQDILYHILKVNPDERFTIDNIKQHPWFNLVQPHLMKGITFNKIKIPVDDNILNMVQNYGFNKEECKKLLLKNKFCSLTSIYYLCLKKYVREGGKSVSDLESDLFEEYINDANNYIEEDNEDNNENTKNDDNNNMENGGLKEGKNFSKSSKENNKNITKEFINGKKENINENINSPNITKEKINLNKNAPRTIFIKNNQTISQKKQNTKIVKKKIILYQNNQQNAKNIKNNILIQDKTPKLEDNLKNNNGQIELKNKNIESKINSPYINKTKNFITKNKQNNINTISIKNKDNNKKTSKGKSQLTNQFIKSPQRINENRSKLNNNYLINSFIGKNKSSEKENHNSNKIAKIKSNKNIKNNKSIKGNNNIKVYENNQKTKNIFHSNTSTNNIINKTNKENNKILSPQKIEDSNINVSPIKGSAYKNIYQNNKSDLTSLEQNDLDKEFAEKKFLDEQKPLNIINYIAKKLVSSSFCRSFNLQYSSNKNHNSGRMPSATMHNNLISNGNLLYSKDSNPINEEIEFFKENYVDSNDNIKENDNFENNKEEQNNYNFYFKDLISILNQKFKKYAPNKENKENKEKDTNINTEIKYQNIDYINLDSEKKIQKNQNIITISNKKHNKIFNDKPFFINTSKDIYSKKNLFKEDSDFSLLEKKINKNINKNLSPKNNNIDKIVYNIKDMTSHYNNFLDISTNYDPGIDSKGNSSIERTDSINKNELKNFSLSLDKKNINKIESDSIDKNKNKKSKFKKDINSEQDKFSKNKFINKNGKSKYLPFYEKKVCINLSNTFGNLSKSENKNKKK